MTIKRKLCAFFMVCVMMFAFTTTAMAAEPETTDTQSASVMTLVDEDGNAYDLTPASAFIFDEYGDATGTVTGTCSIPIGSYTLYYSVTTSCTLYFWGSSTANYSLSGSGSRNVTLLGNMTSWWLVPDNQAISYSYSFMML